jgi:serine/threonine-protein kinase 24/25/MST4
MLKRPTAKELLKHRFAKTAKKTSFLTELIERHERYKAVEEKNKAEQAAKTGDE